MTEEEILRKKLDRLNENSHYGIMIDTEITKIVRNLIKRLEEQKMNATSTENFHDVIAIDFELQTFPNPDVQDKFIVSATNRDDIFCFVFEGPHIADACRKAGLFTGWENDQKIRELENQNKKILDTNRKLKEKIFCKDHTINELEKEAYKLKEENEKLKEAIQKYHDENKQLDELANYWSKEHDNLSERLAILQDENLELKYQLKDIQATKEVVEQKPSTRADILDQAKKCVCGQREQDYGTPESNFQLIADLWTDYLYPTLGYPKKDAYGIKSEDVAMMMALMKIARIRNGGGSGDSFVDLAGYAACGGEIWHGQKAKDQN